VFLLFCNVVLTNHHHGVSKHDNNNKLKEKDCVAEIIQAQCMCVAALQELSQLFDAVR